MMDKPNSQTARPSDAHKFDKDRLPDKIGSSLRQLYDDVLGEEVPDDFLNLLRKADAKGGSTDSRNARAGAGTKASK